MEYRISNLTGTYISLRFLVCFSFFKLVNEPLLNEMNLVNEKLTMKRKINLPFWILIWTCFSLVRIPPVFPCPFSKGVVHVCPLEMLRAHLDVGWRAIIPTDIYTTNSFGKPNLQPQRMAFSYHKDHQDLPAETEHVEQTSGERA